MNTPTLSRSECNVLRGLAIIGIFLHNYCHWIGSIVKENEYQYFQHNVDWLNQVLVNPDLNLPFHLISFFGHYGVPVFLFLSAYGLVLKYEAKPHLDASTQFVNINGKTMWNWKEPLRFIRYHYLKLFKMMIVGFVAFTMLDYITYGPHKYATLDIVAMLGMFNNILPDPDRIIWPGPFWFFGLMLQLYIVYRLFIYRKHWGFVLYARYGEKILMTFHHNVTNFFGIIFCSSIIYSLSGSMMGWTFVPLFICLLSVLTAKFLSGVNWLSGVNRILEWMGGISAALFVCHPITRKIFIPISRQGDMYAGLLLYIVSSICLAWLFTQLMKKIPNPKL